MSTETERTTVPPRKVSLRRGDSGYSSVAVTPATPNMQNGGRKSSCVEQPTLGSICETTPQMHYQRSISGSPPCYVPQHQPHYPPGYVQQPPQCLQQQQYPFNHFQPPQSLPAPSHCSHLAVPTSDEHSANSAPAGNSAMPMQPQLLRTMSYDGDYFRRFYSHGTFARPQQYVTERAEEILAFEEQHMKRDVTANIVQHQPSCTVEQHIIPDNDPVQYPVTAAQPPVVLQRQFSEFPLDQTVLTLGEDGYYLEDRDYNIVRSAGSGGSANCKLSNDKIKHTQFIVKKPNNCNESCRQNVIRESRILQELNHDNVIRFFGAVEDWDGDHTFKIFLEYAEETCGDINYLFCESEDKENFSGNIALIMLYVQQMLYAVNYLHQSCGILHLDIKGKNIVVCNGGYRVKLIDFGNACKVDIATPPSTGGWTPVFASPEMNRGLPPMFSADIWSVLCVAVEMVTGELPWKFGIQMSHEMALYKVGFYEDQQITDLVDFDEYWDKYNYCQQHCEMYEELVDMWKMVFRKDSSSRPSASDLLTMKWMMKMELDGECILHELVEGDGDDVEQSTSQQQQQHEDIGIDVSSPSHPDEQSLSCLSNENSLPYQSLTNGFLSLSMSSPGRDLTYHNQLSHGSEKSDSDSYYDCNSSFSGRTNMLAYGYMPEPNFHPRSQPSSLPGNFMANQLNVYNYQPSVTHPTTNSPDFADLRGDMGRTRASSFGATQSRPTALNTDQNQVSGKRRKSLCNIGSSKSEPTNVLNAAGHMITNTVKRVNSLNYVRDGPKTDSPVTSPRVDQLQSLVPSQLDVIVTEATTTPTHSPVTSPRMDQQLQSLVPSQLDAIVTEATTTPTHSPVTSPRMDQQLQSLVPSQLDAIVTEATTTPTHQRRRSSDTTTPVTDNVIDSGYGRSLEGLRRSVSLDHSQHPPPLNLPDREQHKPDGCSEPSETNPHTLQLASPKNTAQHVEVSDRTTIGELRQMVPKSDHLVLEMTRTHNTLKTH